MNINVICHTHDMKINDLKSLCKSVLKINPKIRFVGIISDKGKLLESETREGVISHVINMEQEMLFMETALRWLMRPEYDEKLGPVDFSLVQRRKVIMMVFSFQTLSFVYPQMSELMSQRLLT
jgi:hypothetical protein